MKIYETYEEVNHDLKILKLQTQINKEKIRLTTNSIKEDFSPVSVATGIIGKIVKRALILKGVAKIVGIRKAKIVNK
jgi:hypothetical protein